MMSFEDWWNQVVQLASDHNVDINGGDPEHYRPLYNQQLAKGKLAPAAALTWRG
jgi:hypothetical protein